MTNMTKHCISLCACAVAMSAMAAGCVGYESKTTTPNTPTTATPSVEALVGKWQSVNTNPIPSPSTCTNFVWSPTQQSPTSAAGSFSATCAGGLQVAGTASGTLSGTTITWQANGTSTAPGSPSCAITLTGTAELGVDSIRVPYSGNTCVGPVSGVEILNRK
jgi:hypothetical protein